MGARGGESTEADHHRGPLFGRRPAPDRFMLWSAAMARPWRRRYRDDRWPAATRCRRRGMCTPGSRRSWSAAGFEDPEEIGRGGFGVVYRCSQPELDRTVAVKVLTADLEPDNLERFVREQVAMGKLSGHPHIVTIFQVGTTATGTALHRDAVPPARFVGGQDPRQRTARMGRRAAHRGEGRGRVGNGAPTRDLASRRQAGEHPAHRVRRTAADRFRDRPHHRRVRDIRRRGHGFAGVYRPRGAAGPAARRDLGCLQPGVDAVLRRHGARGVRAPARASRWSPSFSGSPGTRCRACATPGCPSTYAR